MSVTNLKKKPFIKTKAWIGKDGQDIYEMTIHFESQALSNYTNRQDLKECIPDTVSEEWIKIDPKRKQVEIKLK